MAKIFSLQWTRAAYADWDEILDYIAQKDGIDAALSVSTTLIGKIDSLKRFPERGRLVPELSPIGVKAYRELISAPYRIFFRLDGHSITLLGILDNRRNLEELLIERALRA